MTIQILDLEFSCDNMARGTRGDPLGTGSGEHSQGLRALNFPKVLSVLVNNAGKNPNEPYVMDDLKKGLRIRTNALTHFLVQWEKYKSPKCSSEVLHTLLRYGADARAPALYEVTPLVVEREIFEKQSMLCAASGQSLMAFQMSLPLEVPPPTSNFITDLIQMGHACFLPSATEPYI